MIEPTTGDLATITANVLDRSRTEAIAAGVTVRADSIATATTGDSVLLKRLVENLVHNGIRHNLPEFGWVTVVTKPDADGYAIVTITNSGAIVLTDQIPMLFQPFRRLGGDRVDSSHGAGWGLSIVESVVRAHGGQVDLEARPSGGLVVRVRRPGA